MSNSPDELSGLTLRRRPHPGFEKPKDSYHDLGGSNSPTPDFRPTSTPPDRYRSHRSEELIFQEAGFNPNQWLQRRDSNPRDPAYEAGEIAASQLCHSCYRYLSYSDCSPAMYVGDMDLRTGLEPVPDLGLYQTRVLSHLSYRSKGDRKNRPR